MINRIRDFLYSLKSEKAKRKIEEKAFAAVGEPPKPPISERIRVLIIDEWRFLIKTAVAAIAAAAAIAGLFLR